MTDSKTRPPRLVLTGGLGRVCSVLGPSLSRNYDLIVTDNRADGEQQVADHIAQPLDITDFDATCAMLEGAQYVVHTAIANEPKAKKLGFEGYVNQMMSVNAIGTHHVLEAAHLAGVKRVVLFSSIMTMQGKPQLDRITDQTPPRPAGLYGCTKLFNENLADCYYREKGLSVICLRLGGPVWHKSKARLQQVIDNEDRRGIAVHPEDIARGVQCALSTQNIDFGIANLFSDSNSSWVDLTGADLIGYQPMWRYTEHGAQRIEQPMTSPA